MVSMAVLIICVRSKVVRMGGDVGKLGGFFHLKGAQAPRVPEGLFGANINPLELGYDPKRIRVRKQIRYVSQKQHHCCSLYDSSGVRKECRFSQSFYRIPVSTVQIM